MPPTSGGNGNNGIVDASFDEAAADRSNSDKPIPELYTKQIFPGNERKVYASSTETRMSSALGGHVTAKNKRMGERPRMVGHAIRDDLTDGINQFVSQVLP